jgi:hypothetical protein
MAKKNPKNLAQAASDSPSVVSTFANLNIGAKGNPQPRLTRKNIVAEFQRYFGNANDLGNWQRLCQDVGIEEDIPSITKCKQVFLASSCERQCTEAFCVQALKGVWVNIYDLIDAVRTDRTPPRRFPSQKALAEYTISHQKVYPKKKAKEGGPVRALLAHIFH